MDVHVGLGPEEMIRVFNQMYLDVWEKTRDKVNWDHAKVAQQIRDNPDFDLSEFLLRMFEVVVTAARDGAILTMYYNNEKIYEDLRRVGIELPARAEAQGGEES